MMKQVPASYLTALSELYTTSLNSGKLPRAWKEAKIVPIPKKGKDTYRPISLLPVQSKLMEKIMLQRIRWIAAPHHARAMGFKPASGTRDAIATLVHNGSVKRKKEARRMVTPRKMVVQKAAPGEHPAPSSPNTPVEFSPQTLVINAPQWDGEFPVMIALSTEHPALKLQSRRRLTRTLIRAKDQASQDTLRNITSMQQKPVSFTPLPATKSTMYGIVQRVPLAISTSLLRATIPAVLEADRMSVWNSTAKAAQPTMIIKIMYEGNLPAKLEIGHLGAFT